MAAVAISFFGQARRIGHDTAVAVVVSALFGLGIVLALSPDSPPGLGQILFGDVLGVSDLDLMLAAGLTLMVLAGLWLLHGRLLAVGFDRTTARSLGANPHLVDLALVVMMAIATLVALQGLGNLLVVAILVGPAATARLIARRMAQMMVLATLLAIGAGLGGFYLSFYAGLAAGASIALVVILLYVLVFAVNGVLNRFRGFRGFRAFRACESSRREPESAVKKA